MMNSDEANEVLGIVRRIGPVVLSAAVSLSGTVGTSLRRAVGMMVADQNMINMPTFAYAFSVCVDLARFCQATLVTMDRVRKAALTEAPFSLPAVLTVQAIVRITLAANARIIATTTYKSRDQVEAVAVAINEAFSATEERASDDLDSATYMALIRLHGNVVQHLATRARELPRLISYDYATVMPVLRMAQRAYGDPTRFAELIAENGIVHPAFMPASGKMLAV
jgi:prophage DNA circulation protein